MDLKCYNMWIRFIHHRWLGKYYHQACLKYKDNLLKKNLGTQLIKFSITSSYIIYLLHLLSFIVVYKSTNTELSFCLLAWIQGSSFMLVFSWPLRILFLTSNAFQMWQGTGARFALAFRQAKSVLCLVDLYRKEKTVFSTHVCIQCTNYRLGSGLSIFRFFQKSYLWK